MSQLLDVARALVREKLAQAAVQQMKDLQVLTRLLPSNFLPGLVQDSLQVVRDAGEPELLFPVVMEVERFLILAAEELGLSPALTASDHPRPSPNPAAYRIFRRLLTYRLAALHLVALPRAGGCSDFGGAR